MKAAAAAQMAGYPHPRAAASRLQQNEAINTEIATKLTAHLHNVSAPQAVSILDKATNIDTPGVPWPSRIAAAKIVLDQTRGLDSGQRKEAHEMTYAELQSYAAELRSRADALIVIGGPMIDLEPENAQPTPNPGLNEGLFG
jgi:hypothetical protein